MKKKGILLLLLLLLTNLCNAQIQQVPLSIDDLILSITKFDTVTYLTTQKKVFSKNDHATSWNKISYYGMKYLTSNSNTLFAVMDQGGYSEVKYTNSTFSHFVDMSTGLFRFKATSIAASDSMIYAGSSGEGLISCHLTEKNWKLTPLVDCSVSKIILNNDKVYALTSKGLFYSNADAQVWKKIIIGNTSIVINDFIVDSLDIYCATNQGVFVYNTLNETYVSMNSNIPNINCNNITLFNNKLIVATKGNGLFYTNISQIGWETVNNEKLRNNISRFYNIDSTIYLTSTIFGLYKSSDYGENWFHDAPNISESNIISIGSVDSTLVFGSTRNNGIWKTNINLNDWSKSYDIGSSPEYDIITQIETIDSVLVCLFNRGKLYRSFDKGSTWEPITIPANFVFDLFIFQNTLYIGSSTGIYMTTDFGDNWQQYSDITTNVSSFAKFGNIAYYVNTNYPSKLFRSIDDGMSWTETTLTNVVDINLNAYYAYAILNSDAIYRCSHLVDRWNKFVDGSSSTRIKFIGKYAYYNNDEAIFLSKDYGYSFQKIATILFPSTDEIRDFTITKGNLFVGCNHTFWQMSLTGIVDVKDEEQVPQVNSFDLLQNYPNPFNPSTTIKFEVPQVSNVKLTVYDILGKEVETLINDELMAGSHSINWNPNANGKHLASGMYFCRLNVNNQVKTIKMLYLK